MPRMSNEMLKKLWEFRYEIILESLSQNKSKSDLKKDNAMLKTINQALLVQVMYRDDMSSSGARVKKLPHNHI